MTTRDDDLAFMGAAKLAALVRDKQVSPVELVRLYLDRIDRFAGFNLPRFQATIA